LAGIIILCAHFYANYQTHATELQEKMRKRKKIAEVCWSVWVSKCEWVCMCVCCM